MIDDDCEVIFLDEACSSTMDIDDWKILTQGGWMAHDKKFKNCQGLINRYPMLATSQKDLVFATTSLLRRQLYKFKRRLRTLNIDIQIAFPL